MKRTIILLSMLVMVFALQDAYSQSIRSLMRDKIIKDNLEAQAKKDSARAVEEGREPKDSPRTEQELYMEALGLRGNVDYESSYKFDSYIQMEVTEFNKNGKEKDKTLYDSYVNAKNVGYAMVFKDNKDRSTIVFDDKNSAMLILTDSDGEKTGVAIGIDPETVAEQAEEYQEENYGESYAPKKTGKTKTILGYTCDEYLVEDEDSEAHIWVSEKLGKEVRKEMLNNQQTFGAIFTHASHMNGMVMEYDVLDKDNNERTIMQVSDIDLNHSHTISTGGYSIMSMRHPSGN